MGVRGLSPLAMLLPIHSGAKSTFRLIRVPIELSSRLSGQIDQFCVDYVEYKAERNGWESR